MAVTVRNTRDLKNEGINICVYGESGNGKTKLIETLPKPIIISAEKGLLSVKDSGMDYIPATNWAELVEARNWLLNSSEAKKYDSFAFDSATEIGEVSLQEEMKRTPNGQKAYGEMATKMIAFFREVRNIPRHIYFIAHMELVKDELANTIKRGPSAPGKQLTSELQHMFDELFYYAVWEIPDNPQIQRALVTAATAQYMAKDRSGKLDRLEPANLTHIINKIEGKK